MSDNIEPSGERQDLVRRRARVIRLTWAFWLVVALVIAATLGILVYNAIQATASRSQLLDCTTPEGKCYKESQKQTAKVVQQLITAGADDEIATRRVVVLAASCAAQLASTGGEVTVEAVEQCVDRELKEDEQ